MKLKSIVTATVTGIVLGALVTVAILRAWPTASTSAFKDSFISNVSESFSGLLALNATQLQKTDITTLNLLCAEGLSGTREIKLGKARETLDEWAKKVSSETCRYLYKFRQNPAEYRNSEGYFRVLAMVTVLQQDFHVRYNPQRINAPDFSDPSDLFLTGLLGEKRQGTCVSMPVLYVAIGRRLGYPLKLVTTKAHLLARWESAGGKERFNIEGTNEGLNCFPDEYYHTWPVPMTKAEIKEAHYLKSLTSAEELAVFLSARGHCLETLGRLPEAQLAHAQAHALAPEYPAYLAFLASAVKKEMPDWQRVQVDLGEAEMVKGESSQKKD